MCWTVFFSHLVNFKGELHNKMSQIIMAVLYPEYYDEESESDEKDESDDDDDD